MSWVPEANDSFRWRRLAPARGRKWPIRGRGSRRPTSRPLEFARAALDFSKRHGVPFAYEAHGLMCDSYAGSSGNPLSAAVNGPGRKLVMREEKRIIAHARAVIVQTEAMRRRISGLYGLHPDEVSVIPNGVDERVFDPSRERDASERLRREHGWNKKRVLLYSGFLDNINGVGFLLDALDGCSAEMPGNLRMVILGRGPLEERLRRASRKHEGLDYLGVVEDDQMRAYYGAVRGGLLPRPSSWPAETLIPMKLLAAMAMERVIVASDVGGITEVIQDGKNGMLFEKGSGRGLIRALGEFAGAGGEIALLGREARKQVSARYRWDTSRGALDRVYRKLHPGGAE